MPVSIDIQRMEGAVLGAVKPATHPSGIRIALTTQMGRLSHYRADTLEGVVDRLETEDAGMPEAWVSGDAIYAGVYFAHFGHFLAESIHRLWAAVELPGLAHAPIVFQKGESTPILDWVGPVLTACGVDASRCIFVDRPTQFERLHVPQQGRILGGVTMLPGYADLFPLAPIAADPNAAAIYVSRSRQLRNGSYLGEHMVERTLALAGFTIVHPEEMPLKKTLALMKGAKCIIFAEGSAIHNLELIGRVQAKVMVVARRHGTRRRFEALLTKLATEARFFSRIISSDHPRSDGDRRTTCSLIPLHDLIETIGAFSGKSIEMPSDEEIAGAIEQDRQRLAAL